MQHIRRSHKSFISEYRIPSHFHNQTLETKIENAAKFLSCNTTGLAANPAEVTPWPCDCGSLVWPSFLSNAYSRIQTMTGQLTRVMRRRRGSRLAAGPAASGRGLHTVGGRHHASDLPRPFRLFVVLNEVGGVEDVVPIVDDEGDLRHV